ncbi:hypothetical protein [Asticcacaulis solisilvae]|uniref:hypothetical protein n=1 Tax=Asticcacaulis solisilvae TaxID=1217274 RepID=UPI003FD75D2A
MISRARLIGSLTRIESRINRPLVFAAAVVAVMALTALFGILFGYISVDSWYYMLLAQTFRHGQGFRLHGEYLAVYPAGYPMILGLTAPNTDFSTLVVSSKIANLLLLSGSFFMLWKASKNPLMAAVCVLNPVVLLIGLYTWSENLLFFCFSGALFAITRLSARNDWKNHVLLGVFLVLGCLARYVFAPFALILWLSTWIAFDRKTAIRALPAFAVTGLLFVAYHEFNRETTGFGTGMPRVPAPESFYLICADFVQAFAGIAIWVVAALVILIVLGWRQIRFSPPDRKDSAATFLLLAGAGFLALAFILRARTLFDPFGTRTIGYGISLMAAGLAGLYVHLKRNRALPVAAILVSGVFSAVYADGTAIPDSITRLMRHDYALPAAGVTAMRSRAPAADMMVFFQLPPPDGRMGVMDTVEEINYGPQTPVLSPHGGPDLQPQSAADFIRQVMPFAHKRCYFDFSGFADASEVKDYIGAQTLVDQSFSLIPGKTRSRYVDNYAPSVRAYITAIAQPGKIVPCADILALPQTQAALTAAPGR